MSMAMTLREYLDSLHFGYDTIKHPYTNSSLQTAQAAHVSDDLVAKPLLFGDADSYVLVVIPASHRVDIKHLQQQTGRHLKMVSEEELESIFIDCDKGAIPATGEAYGIDTLVDSELMAGDDVYFESGDHEILIHMLGEEYRGLMRKATGVSVSHAVSQ